MLKQIHHGRLNGRQGFLTALSMGMLPLLLLFLTVQATQAAGEKPVSPSLIAPSSPYQQATTGTLKIKVKDSNNAPLSGISIYPLPYPHGGCTTDANGECTSKPLNAGLYKVLVFDPNGNYANEWYNNSLTEETATWVSITQGQTTTIEMTMDPAAHLEGQVSSGGTPLAGIQVWAILRVNNEWSSIRNADTDANGHYNLGGLPAGTYRVEFSDQGNGNYVTEYYNNQFDQINANTINLTAGQTGTANADLTPAGHIQGTVTNAQNVTLPAVNVTVGRYYSGQWQESWAETQTDEQGRYHVGGLPAGTYRIGFSDVEWNYIPEYYNNKPDAAGADNIPVAEGQTVTINVSLALRGKISGVVTDQQGDPLQENDAGASAYIFENGAWQLVSTSLVEQGGTYTIDQLLPGTYRVGFFSTNYAPEYYNNKPDLDSATDVVVTTSQTTSGINASLGPASHISGMVTNESNTPLSYILVSAYQLKNGSWQPVGSATSSDGAYTIDGLGEGTYRVKFEDNAGIYLAEYYDNKPDLNTANNISVAAAQTVGQINAKLSRGASVDNDLDGIDDTIEANVPNASGAGQGDGNGDGTPDKSQGHVTSLPNAGTVSAYVTLASPVGTVLKAVQITSADPSHGNLPAGVTFPHGFFSYKITNVAANQTVTVTIRLHGGQLPSSYWKYGPTPQAQTNQWYEFSYDNATGTGAVINENIITLYFKDGQRGDADLTVNGTITDPGGPINVAAIDENNTVYLPVVLK